ncbi:MAG TPA: hypothetical protein DCM73_09645 [Clostridiales bacterium]|nr:hypothetical protein [Clostridiales bacterium]
MKKIINAIRDFLYNITDYGLIITVVVVMALILVWRFDILFNKGIEKDVIEQLPEQAGTIGGDNDSESPEPNGSEDPGQTENPEKKPEESSGNGEKSGLIATINIPEGSLPSKIGDILLNSNLIKDKEEFLNRSVELGLDTKLRSGKFEIEVGTSLDDIIKTIANAK